MMLSNQQQRTPYLCAIEADFRKRNAPGGNLHLTARFADDVLKFGPIKIRVAVTRAYLNFILENCDLPQVTELEETWPPKRKVRQTINRSLQDQRSNELAGTATASITPSPSASLALNAGSKSNSTTSTVTTSEFFVTYQPVSWRGSAQNPSLVFDAKPFKDFLSGTLLSGELVGRLEPRGRYYSIELQLEVPRSGLLIEHGQQFSASPNKRGLIRMIAALALCRKPTTLCYRHFNDE